MGGKFRPAVLAVSALALLALASPVAVLTGPLAATHAAAAPPDSKHSSKGDDHDPRSAPATAAPSPVPSADGGAAGPSGDDGDRLAGKQPAAAGAAVANSAGTRSIPGQIELSKPRPDQPSERADHASATSQGRHRGAGDDPDDTATTPPTVGNESTPAASSGAPTAGTQAASTPAVTTAATNHSGSAPTQPPVIVAPPAAPQTNPPIATQPALTGARLDWILVGVVVALAAAVIAAVRVATFRGKRPPR